MKQILILFMCFSFSLYSQQSLNRIEKLVAEIKSNIYSYQKIEKINSKEGTRFVYLNDKELKLIAVKSLEPDAEKNVEWFYAKGQITYIEVNWVSSPSGGNFYNEKCYFENGHLIA